MSAKNLLFGKAKPVIGVLHLPPLPGSPGFRGTLERLFPMVETNANALARWGIDAILVENFGDCPFFPDHVPPHVITIMAVWVRELKGKIGLPFGINILRNDAEGALGAAFAAGADFIRINVHTGVAVTDQGVVVGRAHHTLRYRKELDSQIQFFCDVCVKHAFPLDTRPLSQIAEEAAFRGLADGIIVTGPKTGEPPALEDLKELREALPDTPLLAGSGITPQNVDGFLPLCDGIIVGSALERKSRKGKRVAPEKVRILMKRVREWREKNRS